MCAQKISLVKKWVKCMSRKGVKLEIVNFFFRFDSRISLTTALTNMKLGREMKLCDLTNIGMFKYVNNLFLKQQQKPRAIHYIGGMYVHVTDKEKHCGRRNLIHGEIFLP